VADEELLRVVVVRRGKVRPTELRLRKGEIGLSLFRKTESLDPAAIVEAVRAAGKQGELRVVEIPARVFRELGLRLVRTHGGTPDPAVNALHIETRFPWWQHLVLLLRRRAIHQEFNDRITPRLAEAAKLVEGEG
jgi:Ni,Fe-hydrogenase maturation factor